MYSFFTCKVVADSNRLYEFISIKHIVWNLLFSIFEMTRFNILISLICKTYFMLLIWKDIPYISSQLSNMGTANYGTACALFQPMGLGEELIPVNQKQVIKNLD